MFGDVKQRGGGRRMYGGGGGGGQKRKRDPVSVPSIFGPPITFDVLLYIARASVA